MNRLTQLFFVLFLLCLPVSVMAQKDKNDDSKYLAGAVPEVDGKVVFSKEFNIPGMSQDEIFDRMMKWMETRLKENKNPRKSSCLFGQRERNNCRRRRRMDRIQVKCPVAGPYLGKLSDHRHLQTGKVFYGGGKNTFHLWRKREVYSRGLDFR